MGAASDIAKVEGEDPSSQSFRDQGSNSWKQPIPQKRQISPTKTILKFQLEFPNSSNSTIEKTGLCLAKKESLSGAGGGGGL